MSARYVSRHARRDTERRGRSRAAAVPLALMGAGVLICLAPLVSNCVGQAGVRREVATYTATAESIDPARKAELLAQAQAYNARLGGYDAGVDVAPEEILSYEEQLALEQDGAMGWIEIPSCGIEMKVFHGVGAEVLSAGVGHQSESSLPVGGERSHCYLTGHTGMRELQIFDGIRQLEEGDVFAIHVLGEVFAYRVTGWRIVEPTDVDFTPGPGDVCTLVTCTTDPDPLNPKGRAGVNDKRLLVTGERCAYVAEEFEQEDPGMGVYVNDATKPALLAAGVLAALGAGLAVGRVASRRHRRARNRRTCGTGYFQTTGDEE